MEKLEYLPRQQELMRATADNILFGGARGGGKSFSNAAKMALDVVEHYTERQMKLRKLNKELYRESKVSGKKYYYRYLIDFPAYMGVIVRKTEPELLANTKVECDKIYPEYGGKYIKSEKKYVFPSGAEIWLRPCGKKEHEQFFIGSNFHRVSIEELTAFERETVDVILSCNRSTHQYIDAKFIATTNPGLIGHCVPYGEVLTKNGWKDIKDIQIGEMVASANDDEKLIYLPVEQVIAEHYTGEIYDFKSSTMKMICTPEHKVTRRTYTKNKDGRKWHKPSLLKIKDVPEVTHIVRSVKLWNGIEIETFVVPDSYIGRKLKYNQPEEMDGNLYCEFMGWFLSEGHTTDRDKEFSISQIKPHNRIKIRNLLDEIGFQYREHADGFTVSSPNWYNYLKQFGKCRDKFVPDIIKNATSYQLKIFWQSMMDGDGHNNIYYTTSHKLADDMQDIGLKLNYTPLQRNRQRKNRKGLSYEVVFRKPRDGWLEKSKIKKIDYDGMVYCLGIPETHRFFLRQDGNIWLSGNSWVKEMFVTRCKPISNGDKQYLEKYDISYQPIKGGKPFKRKETGLTYQFIPSLVFDNPYLAEKNESYVRYLMGLNTILREMWLFGNWNVFAGQFFDMWNESKHMMPEWEFYGAKKGDRSDLAAKRLNFDWSNFRLYRSYDYGYAENSAWACGAYAVHNTSNRIIKFAEIVKSKLTASMQARYVNEHFKTHYDLTPDDFEMEIADPKSFWQKMDSGDGFITAHDRYRKEGIFLVEGINKREQGAMAMLEALRIREDGLPQLRYLSCCEESRVTIPNLPADPKNPNDVDTKARDHSYDSDRYFIMKVRASGVKISGKEEKEGWRDRISKKQKDGNVSWRVA